MKLGLMVGYWMFGPQDPTPLAQEAERLGYDSVWTAEAYGSDAISPLAWIGARTSKIKLGTGILQISARTPACVAMTAMTLDHLTGGRLILGLGVSGPQVVEGWYGQPFPKPLGRTREFIALLRQMLRREGPVTFKGKHYQLPLEGGTGLGKPLKLITRPLRSHVPIYLGAEGPKNIALAAELCDGWLPLYYTPFRPEVYANPLDTAKPGFEIACPVTVNVHDDVKQALLPVKYMLAFYIGGMGAKEKNFHANLVRRMGYEEAADKIQDLFFAGKRDEAAAAVPDEFADEISLVGPKERIRERLQVWKKSAVTTILAGTGDVNALRVLAEAAA
ncbi:MAG: LLM class F420-dependent oxidoreductase [Thermodesulfobacteriota bacterium]